MNQIDHEIMMLRKMRDSNLANLLQSEPKLEKREQIIAEIENVALPMGASASKNGSKRSAKFHSETQYEGGSNQHKTYSNSKDSVTEGQYEHTQDEKDSMVQWLHRELDLDQSLVMKAVNCICETTLPEGWKYVKEQGSEVIYWDLVKHQRQNLHPYLNFTKLYLQRENIQFDKIKFKELLPIYESIFDYAVQR